MHAHACAYSRKVWSRLFRMGRPYMSSKCAISKKEEEMDGLDISF